MSADTTIPTVVTYHEALAYNLDDWKTATLTFTATSSSQIIKVGTNNVGVNGAVGAEGVDPWGTPLGLIVWDAYSASQLTSQLPLNASNGVTLGALMPAVSDADNGASLKGYAITSAAADTAGHHWQYSTNGGTTWVNMDSASLSQAVYLATTDLLRWTGSAGTNTELDAKAVDNTGPALHAANAVATLVDASASGGSTAFSGNTAVLAANAPPIVFDLNHDGHIDYSNITMSMDGHQVNTAWVGANDGILLWDKYGDATVHGSDQYVFGQATGSDLSGLKQAFDINQDGIFNAKDAQFAQFGIWQDRNQDGVIEAGEFHTLSQLGITSLSLTSDGVSSTPATGVTVHGQTTATAADGTQVLVADVGFAYTSLGYSMGTDSAGLGTLKLADGAALNLAQVGKQSSSALAVVDLLSDSAANALTLGLQDVLDLSGGNLFNSGTSTSASKSASSSATSAKQLAVLGDAQDTVQIGTGWTNSGTVVNYAGHDWVVYNSNTSSNGMAAQLFIEQAMVNAQHVVM